MRYSIYGACAAAALGLAAATSAAMAQAQPAPKPQAETYPGKPIRLILPALLAPANTPRAVIDRLNAEAVKVMNTAQTRASLAAMGGEPASYSSEQTAQFLSSEYARWGKVIREAKIKTE